MLTWFLLVNVFGSTASLAGDESQRCKPPASGEEFFYSDDYNGKFSWQAMKELYEKKYESGARLKGRAYFDERLGSFVFPQSDSSGRTRPVKFNRRFVRNVARHIEIALERRYADFVFFPDMGHSHLHLPESDYDRMIGGKDEARMYEDLFAFPKLKMLYHTAEKLDVKPGARNEGPFPQDPVILWRYFSRNPVGDNLNGEEVFTLFQGEEPEKYNTVKKVPGHKEYSAGFYIHASRSGCFPFTRNGKTFYFDISLEGLPCKDCD